MWIYGNVCCDTLWFHKHSTENITLYRLSQERESNPVSLKPRLLGREAVTYPVHSQHISDQTYRHRLWRLLRWKLRRSALVSHQQHHSEVSNLIRFWLFHLFKQISSSPMWACVFTAQWLVGCSLVFFCSKVFVLTENWWTWSRSVNTLMCSPVTKEALTCCSFVFNELPHRNQKSETAAKTHKTSNSPLNSFSLPPQVSSHHTQDLIQPWEC